MRHFRFTSPLLRLASALLVGALAALAVPAAAANAKAVAKVKRVVSVNFVGHGYGAGIGMGQWGDFGYAVRYHFGYTRILNHYYGGTAESTLAAVGQPTNPVVSVLLVENLNLQTNVGFDPVVTSPSGYSISNGSNAPIIASSSGATGLSANSGASGISGVGGASGVSGGSGTSGTVAPGTLAVAPGVAIDLRLEANGTWNAFAGSSCAAAQQAANVGSAPIGVGFVNPVVSPASTSSTAADAQLLSVCRHDGVDETVRGQVQAYDRDGYERTLNLLPLQSYLQAVVPAEASASWGADGGSIGAPQGEAWGFQALEAQAVAARSYEAAYAAAGGWNGYADICDSTLCQAYVGANFENSLSNAAVALTAGEVRVQTTTATSTPHVVSTRYSASTGGFTAPGSFPAVRDLGDTCVVPQVPLECNPNHTWRVSISAALIMSHYRSIGHLLRLRVSARDGHGSLGGRALEVTIVGDRTSLSVSADSFVSAVGLRSDWFAVRKLVRRRVAVTTTTTTTTLTTVPTTSTTAAGISGATGTS